MDELLNERYELVKERISLLLGDTSYFNEFGDYIKVNATLLNNLIALYEKLKSTKRDDVSIDYYKSIQADVYSDILGDNYLESYTNPTFAVKTFGKEVGQKLCFLATELRSVIPYAYRGGLESIVLFGELFIQIETLIRDFVSSENDKDYLANELYDILYSFELDNSEIFVNDRLLELFDPDKSFAYDIIMNSDLGDEKYLYYYGEYIGDNEIATHNYLKSFDNKKLYDMAYTYTHGYDEGFKVMLIDRTGKDVVNIRYNIGFELMVREAIKQFEELGLKPVIYPLGARCQDKKLPLRVGYQGTPANKQYDYDHRFDKALYFDKRYVLRRLEILKSTYNDNKDLFKRYAGPAVIEVFGESDFTPTVSDDAYLLSEEQKKLDLELTSEASILSNQYLKQDEISFTIIAYPLAEIGEDYEAIFEKTIEINTLDNDKYRAIQSHIINALDKADYVIVKGAKDNETDMKVMLHVKKDPEHETNFENCVADVNIPLGEVFTSPMLTGTEGVLNVSSAYLNDLYFKNIRLEFKDGMVSNYTCDNYEEEKLNKSFIEENLLRNNETLPIGEFAIGTNTTAYKMAKDFDIISKLPILIVEKTGPHFAVGDTCYSHAEDHKVYNPDGKEIIARENECSMLRHEDESKAYYHIHTDITIPYEEIELIAACLNDGSQIDIIRDGRFVLEGTEALNEALD